MKKTFLSLILLSLLAVTAPKLNAQSWSLTGNSGTKGSKNFVGTTDYKTLVFRTNNVEQMRIGEYGNVGIGTKNPLAKLQVENGPFATLSTPGCIQIGSPKAVNIGMDYNSIQARNNGAASGLYLNYFGGDVLIGNHSGNAVPSLFAASDGRAAIGGTTLAAAVLTVNQNPALTGISVQDPLDNYMFYSVKSGTNAGIFVSKTSTASNTATITSSNSGYGEGIFANAANGSGVVGLSSYSNGIYGLTDQGSYAGYFEGNVYSTGIYQGSDEKLKENIKDVISAMDIINQLHPKLYDFRHDGNYKLMHLPEGNHYGLIAQDVEKVLPNLIKDAKFETRMAKLHISEEDAKNSESINFKALNYTELIPIMIKGMQEQQQLLDKQQQVNEQQQLEIAGLKQMIQSITQNKSDVFSTPATAYLSQNTPNPFTADTKIQCTVSPTAKTAQVIVSAQDGKQLQSYNIRGGNSQITIHGSTLPAGSYLYSLVIDGKISDTKIMILTR